MEDHYTFEEYSAMWEYSKGNLEKMLESSAGIFHALWTVIGAVEKRLEDTLIKIKEQTVQLSTLEECEKADWEIDLPTMYYQKNRGEGMMHEMIVLKAWLTSENIGSTFNPLFSYYINVEGVDSDSEDTALVRASSKDNYFPVENLMDLLEHIEKLIKNDKIKLTD